MQVPRPHVHQAAGIYAGIDDVLADLPGFDQAGFMGVTRFDQLRVFGLQPGELRRGVGQFAEAPAQVAIDAVFANPIAHDLYRFNSGAFQITYTFGADMPGEPADVVADAAINWPPLRPLAPQPIRRASSRITESPRWASSMAVLTPVKPPPITQTSAVSASASAGRGVRLHSRCGVVGMGVFVGVLIHLLDFTLLHERVIRRMIDWGGVVEI